MMGLRFVLLLVAVAVASGAPTTTATTGATTPSVRTGSTRFCTFLTGYAATNYHDIETLPLINATACQAACASNRNCAVWYHCASWAHFCWLKPAGMSPTAHKETNATSGTCTTVDRACSAGAADFAATLNNTYRYLPGASPQECADACFNDAVCGAWTATTSPQSLGCYLTLSPESKKSFSAYAPGAISGLCVNSTVAPPTPEPVNPRMPKINATACGNQTASVPLVMPTGSVLAVHTAWSETECATNCRKTQGCHTWVLQPEHGRRCTLLRSSCWTSMRKAAPGNATGTCGSRSCQPQIQTALQGGTLMAIDFDSTLDACQLACGQDPDCAGYMHIPTNTNQCQRYTGNVTTSVALSPALGSTGINTGLCA